MTVHVRLLFQDFTDAKHAASFLRIAWSRSLNFSFMCNGLAGGLLIGIVEAVVLKASSPWLLCLALLEGTCASIGCYHLGKALSFNRRLAVKSDDEHRLWLALNEATQVSGDGESKP